MKGYWYLVYSTINYGKNCALVKDKHPLDWCNEEGEKYNIVYMAEFYSEITEKQYLRLEGLIG